MLKKIFEGEKGKLFVENRLLKISVMLITCATFYNGYAIRQAVTKSRTIVMPMNFPGKLTFIGDFASEDYIKMMGQVVIPQISTYHYSTVRGQLGNLVTMFAPEKIEEAKKLLMAMADAVERQKVGSVFVPVTWDIDIAHNTLTANGEQQTYVDGQFIDVVRRAYTIEYRIENGRFFLLNLSEKITKIVEESRETAGHRQGDAYEKLQNEKKTAEVWKSKQQEKAVPAVHK